MPLRLLHIWCSTFGHMKPRTFLISLYEANTPHNALGGNPCATAQAQSSQNTLLLKTDLWQVGVLASRSPDSPSSFWLPSQ